MTLNASNQPIGWLGTTPFALVTTLASVSRNQRTKVIEHPIMGGKPTLQVTGDELSEVRMTIHLHEMICDVAAENTKLTSLRENHQPASLMWANGEVWGDFLIVDIEQIITWMVADGSPRSMNLSLSLKEHTAQDAIAEQRRAAQNNAPAVRPQDA